jgi:hypothetical protein
VIYDRDPRDDLDVLLRPVTVVCDGRVIT